MKKISELSRQQKDYIFYSILAVIAIAFLFFIFRPSDSEKEKVKELNTSLPDGEEQMIPERKARIYEEHTLEMDQRAAMEKKIHAEGLMSLDEVLGDKSAKLTSDDRPSQSPDKDGKSIPVAQSIISESNTQVEELHKQTAELNEQLAELRKEKEDKQNSHLELLNEVYKNAGLYNSIPQETPTNAQEKKEVKIKAVKTTVSSPVSSIKRNAFRGIGTNEEEQKNTIRATVFGTQKVMSGHTLRFRLREPMLIGDLYVKQGTVLTGICRVGIDRLMVTINTIEYNDIITHVTMDVYDRDGQEGICLPGSLEMEAGRDIAINVANSVANSSSNNTSLYNTTPNPMEQVKADVTKGVITGTANYISQKLSQVKVTVHDDHQVFLLPKK